MVRFKRRASFLFTGQMTMDGTVQDMTGWTMLSQLRRAVKSSTVQGEYEPGQLISDIPCQWINPVLATYQVGSGALDTESWPLGLAMIDLKLTSPIGTTVITMSDLIMVIEAVTQ